MATLCKQEFCTSCMACFNSCPFNAISIVENRLSVKVPDIDNEKCHECGLCEKSCPIINNSLCFNYPSEAIALYAKYEFDRSTCSSGGAATTFARSILSQGGIVYGVTAIKTYPKFVRVTQIEDLELLKGSKYVYCNPDLIYRQVRDDISRGTECLFIGLPCQIAGLKQFLRKEYDNLYTIDLICHGTPPFKYLKSHIESKLDTYRPDFSVSFRGERDFCITVYDTSKRIVYSRDQYEDEYFAAFMRGWIYKPSCYTCNFARPERISDITIGDFWGIDGYALDKYAGKISVALINTSKGEKLFNLSKDSFIWEIRTVEEAVNGNEQLRQPTYQSEEAKRFQDIYSSTHSFTQAINGCGMSKIIKANRIRRILLTLPKMFLQAIKSKSK